MHLYWVEVFDLLGHCIISLDNGCHFEKSTVVSKCWELITQEWSAISQKKWDFNGTSLKAWKLYMHLIYMYSHNIVIHRMCPF
jgi:hypothetical protein